MPAGGSGERGPSELVQVIVEKITLDLESQAIAKAIADAAKPVDPNVLVQPQMRRTEAVAEWGHPGILRQVEATPGTDIEALDRLRPGDKRRCQYSCGKQGAT